MPEAFPEFDKKPAATPPTDEDATDEVADPQGEAHGEPSEPGAAEAAQDVYAAPPAPEADSWEADVPAEDPYESPYHAGAAGSGATQAGPEPVAVGGRGEPEPRTEEADPQEAIGLDGTGVAGFMRRWAVARSADAAGRRTVLGMADHVEAIETRLGGVLAKPLKDRGMDGLARRVERNPLATVAGALLAGWIVNRMLD